MHADAADAAAVAADAAAWVASASAFAMLSSDGERGPWTLDCASSSPVVDINDECSSHASKGPSRCQTPCKL